MDAIRPRATTSLFQTAARVWLTLAMLSLALPAERRVGMWLPLHLALAGAVGTAISGAMQNFALALTAGAGPSERMVRIRFGLLVAGVGGIAAGFPWPLPWLVALGGASYVASMAMLGLVLWRAWTHSLQRRHPVPMAAYGLAVSFVLLGGVLGALRGAEVFGAAWWPAVRRIHLTLNLLGFASLTVVGTLVTFLPTLLRIRIPPWRGRLTVGLLTAGPLLLATGEAAGSRGVFLVGAVSEVVGAATIVAFAVTAFRQPRSFAIPGAAMHMAAGLSWFLGGTLTLAWVAREGPSGIDAARTGLLTAFVAGWLLQVLLAAWSYLLPMARPGRPEERRRQLSVAEAGARIQLVALNGGLLLFLSGHAGVTGTWGTQAGAGIALAAGAVGLAKAWVYPWLGRGRAGGSARARAVWGA